MKSTASPAAPSATTWAPARPGTARDLSDGENLRHVFIRDLVMQCSIGVHAHEHEATQRIRLSLDLGVREGDLPIEDDLRNVVCYDEIISAVRQVVRAGHVRLIETLAERIAGLCLADPRIRIARVEIEKLDVYKDVSSVGVAIERRNRDA